MPKTKQSKKGRGQKRNNDPLVKKPGALADDGRPKPYNIHRNGSILTDMLSSSIDHLKVYHRPSM